MSQLMLLPLPKCGGEAAAACYSRSSCLISAAGSSQGSRRMERSQSPARRMYSTSRRRQLACKDDFLAAVAESTPPPMAMPSESNAASPSPIAISSDPSPMGGASTPHGRPQQRHKFLQAAHFSTSAKAAAPPAMETSTPVTLGSPSKSANDLLAWWHRTVKYSTSSESQYPYQQQEFSSSSSQHSLDSSSAPPISKPSPSSASSPLSSSSPASSASSSSSSAKSRDSGSPGSLPQQSESKSSETLPEYLQKPTSDINTLIRHPDLMNNIRPPRNVIVLCHGLYGFDVRRPFFGLEIHYWAATLEILRKKIGADVIVRGVPGTGSIASRAKALHEFLLSEEAGVKGAKLNFVGHSMGGLDARYLVSHLKPKPEEYTPVSVTTICTPHKGSPFMDWCNANVGIGKDYVEECIKEYEEQVGNAKAKVAEERSEEIVKKSSEEGEKLPYSLSSPLFVRPKKQNGETRKLDEQNDVVADKAKEAFEEIKDTDKVKETIQAAANQITTKQGLKDTDGSKGEKATKSSAAKEKTSSASAKTLSALGIVSPLTGALSSLGGFFSSYMLSMLDQPAYAMLSTRYMAKVFNPSTPDSDSVKYFSVAARTRKLPLWHPLWLPKVILDAAAESRTAGSERDGSAAALGNKDNQGNDGLVSVQSAKWGQFLGVVEDKDHWDLRGEGAPRWGSKGNINPATGKPFRSAENKEKHAAQRQKAAEGEAAKEKKSEDGWLPINRLLRTFLGSRFEPKPAEDGQVLQSAAAEVDHAKSKDQGSDTVSDLKAIASKVGELKGDASGLIDEVATWISDRLPEGSEERRKLADETAELQEQAAGSLSGYSWEVDSSADSMDSTSLFDDKSSVASSATSVGAEAREAASPMSIASAPTADVKPQDVTSSAPLFTPSSSSSTSSSSSSDQAYPTRRHILKLTREIEWLESDPSRKKDNEEKLRELRADVKWSEEELGRREALSTTTSVQAASTTTSSDAASPSSSSSSSAQQQSSESQNDTEVATSTAKDQETDKEKDEDKKKDSSDKVHLERFWVAICQHLYSHGF